MGKRTQFTLCLIKHLCLIYYISRIMGDLQGAITIANLTLSGMSFIKKTEFIQFIYAS